MGQVIPLTRRERAPASGRQYDPAEPRFTGKQICAILGISESTLKRRRKDGMPYEVWGPRAYRYTLSAVVTWGIRSLDV